jgi:hypothetical protein
MILTLDFQVLRRWATIVPLITILSNTTKYVPDGHTEHTTIPKHVYLTQLEVDDQTADF